MADTQGAVVAFLSNPATYGASVSRVERIDTHISLLFLAGERVFKLKRAVVLDFLDYGTPDKRRFYCEREVALNRRTAPEMYLGVRAINRDADGRLTIDGPGVAIDWVVEMVRFDTAGLFGKQADMGTLTLDLVRRAADEVAALHRAAEIVTEDRGGDEMGVAPTIDQLRDGLHRDRHVFGADRVAEYMQSLDTAHRAQQGQLARRFGAGWVRVCHGDLHLNNICMFNGRPTLFDAAEANKRFVRIDVLYDLAFLLMDLEVRGLRGHANAALNRYAAWGENPHATLSGLCAMPLFQSLRAAIRAEVSVMTAGRVATADAADHHIAGARRYFDLARKLLVPRPAALVAIGGASGSGKTSVARAIAPALGVVPGAVVVRSDEIRKALFGVSDMARLPDAAYGEAWNRRTYAEMTARVEHTLAAGHACVVDAVHGVADERAEMEALAGRAGVPFHGIWLEAPEEILRLRTERRVGDASDAGPAVVTRQLRRGFGAVGWTRVDAAANIAVVSKTVQEILSAGPVRDCLSL